MLRLLVAWQRSLGPFLFSGAYIYIYVHISLSLSLSLSLFSYVERILLVYNIFYSSVYGCQGDDGNWAAPIPAKESLPHANFLAIF